MQISNTEPGKRVYCSFPWKMMLFFLEGLYAPCCHIRIKGEDIPDSVDEMNKYWNSPEMQLLRKKLVTGDIHDIPCAHCYDRMFHHDLELKGFGGNIPKYSSHNSTEFDAYIERANEAYLRGDTVLEDPPVDIGVIVSELCNVRCIMCGQDHKDNKQVRCDTSRVKSLIKDIGWERLDRFSYVGGEAFISTDGRELQKFVCEEETKGTTIFLTTNGKVLDKNLDDLEDIENLFLVISVEGKEEVYENIRVNAKWDNLTNNLRLLKEKAADHPNWKISFSSLVMKSTLPYLKDIIELAQDTGADVLFSPLDGGPLQEHIFYNPDLAGSCEEFNQIIDEAIDYAKEAGDEKATESLQVMKTYYNILYLLPSERAAQIKLTHSHIRGQLLKCICEADANNDMKRLELAIRTLISYAPEMPKPYIVMSELLKKTGRESEAYEYVQKAFELASAQNTNTRAA